jgi:hypothetical protein
MALSLLLVFPIAARADWALKLVSEIPSGIRNYGGVVCSDSDHDSLPEISFWRADPYSIWSWQTWEYRNHNWYGLVKSETCVGYPTPGPGMHKGGFVPLDAGDVDMDGRTDMLGINDVYFWDTLTGTYDSLQHELCIYESPRISSYADSLVWKWSYGTSSPWSPSAWLPGDLDFDGLKEIVFYNRTTSQLDIFECRPDGQIESVYATPFRAMGDNCTFGDFDGDGHNEIVWHVNNWFPSVLIYRCSGDDQYEFVDSTGSGYVNGLDVCSGRALPGATLPEFFVVYMVFRNPSNPTFYPCMFTSDGNGHFAQFLVDSIPIAIDPSPGARQSTCADIDGDGQDELIVSYNTGVRTYKADTAGRFQRTWNWVNPVWRDPPDAYVRCCDMNNNGYPDIIISGNGFTRIYEVEAIRVLTPNGGEQLRPGDTCLIHWRAFNPPRRDSISLFLRADTTWSLDTIVTGLAPTETAYSWVVPSATSDSCRIVAIAYGPGWQYDESDSCFRISSSGAEDRRLPLVRETRLLGAFPNPCRALATIRFQLREKGRVAMRVCDASGRIVQTLAHGVRNPGVYSVNWDASKAPSGVYFVSFDAPGSHATEKLIVAQRD